MIPEVFVLVSTSAPACWDYHITGRACAKTRTALLSCYYPLNGLSRGCIVHTTGRLCALWTLALQRGCVFPVGKLLKYKRFVAPMKRETMELGQKTLRHVI